jgi:transcriptional regulator with XRE-family HTH domain
LAVSIKDVASRAGVSIATVSHMLNGTRASRPQTQQKALAAPRMEIGKMAFQVRWAMLSHPTTGGQEYRLGTRESSARPQTVAERKAV